MKRPILCLFMAGIFMFATFEPFTTSNAAELWNATPRGKTAGKGSTLYNKRGGSSDNSLYNRKTQSRNNILSPNHGLSSIRTSKYVQMSGQHPSKLWRIMSPSAVKNRQADIDLALQQEYNIKKTTAKLVNNAIREGERHRIAGDKQHQKMLDKYEAERAAEKQERLDRKYNFLNGGATKPNRRTYKSTSTREETGLKKPRKLFNTRY